MSKQLIPGPVEGPLADNERLKRESDHLRGTIAEDLQDPLTGGFNGDNFQLIRFHGMYQQDDRDIRPERTAQKLEPLHNVMLRARLPGGIITPAQWQVIDAVKNHRVYLMPDYAKAWGYPMPEAMGIGELWMAKKLYPEKFKDIDMRKVADEWYQRFYRTHYEGID